MSGPSSSFVATPNDAIAVDNTRPSDEDRQPYTSDPFNFLNDPGLLHGIPDPSSSAQSQTTAPLTGSSMTSSTPMFLENGGNGNLPAQLDFSGLSFNEDDLSFMNYLLSYQPTPFSSSIQNVMRSTEPFDSGHLYPSFPHDTGDLSSTTYPSNTDSSSRSPSSDLPAPPPKELQQGSDQVNDTLRTATSDKYSDMQELEKLTARARQIVGLNVASEAHVDVTAPSNKVPIPRLPASSLSGLGGTSPSPSTASTNSRSKLSHCAVERRYRVNMREHLRNLRDVVPALHVLELKSGNRISNLSLKPGIRRIGVDTEPGTEGEDVIDERGYIDGVKVACNGSKTTLVLKTIEYIRVLKRREMRLKREQDGLRTLVRSFPRGPELLQQWETMWREKYGGPEKDEIEEEVKEEKESGSYGGEEADNMDDGEHSSAMSGRENAKRVKTKAISSRSDKVKSCATMIVDAQPCYSTEVKKLVPIEPAPSCSNAVKVSSVPAFIQPAKRKRGRPRKTPLPLVAVSSSLAQGARVVPQQKPAAGVPASSEQTTDRTSSSSLSEPCDQHQHQKTQSGQLLLAISAFFSFFVEPIRLYSSSYGVYKGSRSAHVYSGSVLVGHELDGDLTRRDRLPRISSNISWSDALQVIHLAVSAFLFFSILLPRICRLARLLLRSLYTCLLHLNAISIMFKMPSNIISPSVLKPRDKLTRFREAAQKIRELADGRVVTRELEAQVFREGLGLKTGVIGLLLTLFDSIRVPDRHEHWRLERRTFHRVVELVALDGNSSVCARIQMLIGSFRFNYGCSSSATELASLALIMYPLWRAKAVAIWELALARVHGRNASPTFIYKPFEIFVLETMSIDEAARRIQKLDRKECCRIVTVSQDDGTCRGEISRHRELASPLAALAKQVVIEYVHAQLEDHLVRIVTQEQDDSVVSANDETLDSDRLIAVGRYLDPPTVTILDQFEQIRNPDTTKDAVAVVAKQGGVGDEGTVYSNPHEEVQTLIDAITLYRKFFVMVHTKQGGPCSPSSNIGPSTSISRPDSVQRLDLERCLQSAAFDRTDALRNARNRLLEMISAGTRKEIIGH